MQISQTDLAIIQALADDPRMPNKAIGMRVGVSQQTVAVRLRKLMDGNVIRVMAQRDLAAAGLPVLALAGISIDHSDLKAITRQLGSLPELFSVAVCPGTPDIYVNINCRTPEDVEQVAERIRALPGVRHCSTMVCRKLFKFVSGAGDLKSGAARPSLALTQDRLDQFIIDQLSDDGRRSLRQIAMSAGVSEGTVRTRLQRLTDQNIIRVGLICEPDMIGYQFSAYVFFDGGSEAILSAMDAMMPLNEASFLGVTDAGGGMALLVARTIVELHEICIEKLRAVPGIGNVTFRPLAFTTKHNFDYIHIVGQRFEPLGD